MRTTLPCLSLGVVFMIADGRGGAVGSGWLASYNGSVGGVCLHQQLFFVWVLDWAFFMGPFAFLSSVERKGEGGISALDGETVDLQGAH